jgi:heme oxygenase
MELREAVKTNHDLAEKTALSQLMISGMMREQTYAAMLENMIAIYAELESDGMISKHEVLRYQKASDDLARMGGSRWPIADSVSAYVGYLRGLDAQGRWAHVYVHYLGNMYGGQMIGRKLPGPHDHLMFDDLKSCIAYVRENIADISHDEANTAFRWTIRIYDELHQLFG